MTFSVGNVTIDEPVLLAPMAGITDAPFRALVSRFGAGLVVSEMIASREVVAASKAAQAKSVVAIEGTATAVQIAGCDPQWMREAARIVADRGAQIVDINMGCPAKKVTGGWSGSALMREPDHALRLIEAVVGAVNVPVTLKMRLGWDGDDINAPQIASRAEAAGIRMVTVHGRTRNQFYEGSADWSAIAAVKAAVSIPVVANGDIVDVATARAALTASGADAVMIGRGAQGAPWVPAMVAAQLRGHPYDPPQDAGRLSFLMEQYEAMLSLYGHDVGLRVARKHVGWTLDRIAGTAGLRARIMKLDEAGAVLRALADWREPETLVRAA